MKGLPKAIDEEYPTRVEMARRGISDDREYDHSSRKPTRFSRGSMSATLFDTSLITRESRLCAMAHSLDSHVINLVGVKGAEREDPGL